VITLYFLECPWDKTRQGWKYILQPLLWGTGLVSATISYLVYINVSGNLTSKFGSSFTSDLLWNRLWPNSTFQLGILFGVVVASVPLWFVIFFRLRRTLIYRNGIKWFAYAGMALTLFLGGLIVSVKIGGGSNLHNMDAYFVLLMTGTSYLFWGKDVYDQEPSESNRKTALPLWVISLAIFIPILLTVREGWVISKPDPIQDSLDLHKLSQLVADTAEDGGDVLFIAERQLQVFDLIPDIPFIADYEKLELMEMAMSGNSVYLDRFYEDVSNQRFALIISDPIRFDFKDNADAFSEEHNVWVEKVVLPLLKYYNYSPLENHKSINILTPKQ
jgi:hypothetical protein